MTRFYSAGPQLIKVRALTWFSVAFAAGMVLWGIDLAQTYGTRPADGGVLAPLPIRLLWLLTLSAIGLSFAIGMWAYGRRYVAEARYDRERDLYELITPGFIGSSRTLVRPDEIVASRSHRGQLHTGKHSVDAPWHSVRIVGRSTPFIFDAGGEVIDAKELERLLKRRGERS